MLKEPLLTIIMPVYNTADYLAHAFEALLHQDEPNFKLIVVDDGSTDDSAAIAQKYAQQFPYFKLVQKANGGPSEARNVGMKYVDTPYFTFHDGDDWVSHGYTAYFLRAFKEHPECDLVSCGYWLDYSNKPEKVVGHFESGEINRAEAYLKMTNVFGSPIKGYSWNKAFKTEVVRKYKLKFDRDISLLEDQIFSVKYMSHCEKMYYTQHPYYHYRQRQGSIIHQPSIKKVKDNFLGNYRVWNRIIKSLLASENSKSERTVRKLSDSTLIRRNNEGKGKRGRTIL